MPADSPNVRDDEIKEPDIEAKDRVAVDVMGDQVTLGGEAPQQLQGKEKVVYEVGRVAEQGTYDELIRAGGAFAKLVEDFGGGEGKKAENEEKEGKEDEDSAQGDKLDKASDGKEELKKKGRNSGAGKLEGKLIQAEKRTIGSVEWSSKCACSFRSTSGR